MRISQDEMSRRFYQRMAIPTLLLLLLFFFIPLLFTLSSAFITEEGVSFQAIVSVFTDAYTLRIMRFTLLQATISTLASLIIALPGAYLLSTYSFRTKRLILALSAVPFVIPSILVVLGFVIFFGNNGFLNRVIMSLFSLDEPPIKILYSFTAIILANTFYNFPIIMNLVATYSEQMDRRLEAASYTLGSSRLRTFFTITLPRLLPSIISSASLVFLFCFNSFAIILVLGGGPRYTTMEVEIYRQARMVGSTTTAASLSLFSIAITSLLLVAYNASQKRLSRQEVYDRGYPTPPRKLTALPRIFALLYTLFSLLFVLGPIVSVIVRSFLTPATDIAGPTLTVRWYRQLLSLEYASSHMGSALPALLSSLAIGVAVALLALIFGTLLAAAIKRKTRMSGALELFGMLSMTVSSVIIGLGYFLISSRLRGGPQMSYTLIVCAHLIIALPFVLRAILPEYRKIPHTYSDSALTLGATPRRTFLSIELPLLKGAMASGAIFAFALSMGEFNATLTLSSGSVATLPVIMYRLIGSYNFQGACALGTILIGVSALVFIATGLTRGKRHG